MNSMVYLHPRRTSSSNVVPSPLLGPASRAHLDAIRSPVTINNKGIHICLPLKPLGPGKDYYAVLMCAMTDPSSRWVAIRLLDISQHGRRFVRSQPHETFFLDDSIVKKPSVRMVHVESPMFIPEGATTFTRRYPQLLSAETSVCDSKIVVLTLGGAFLLFLLLFDRKPFHHSDL